MTAYQVYLETLTARVTIEVDAASPEEAVDRARHLAATAPSTLDFEQFALIGSVEYAEAVTEDGTALASWTHPRAILRDAAPELLDAAKEVLACWESGDLAAAIRHLDAVVGKAEG